jgi:hypothetical protein
MSLSRLLVVATALCALGPAATARAATYTVDNTGDDAGKTACTAAADDCSLRGALLNVFDARYAYNFGNPFSGTHFGAPRSASATVRVETR